MKKTFYRDSYSVYESIKDARKAFRIQGKEFPEMEKVTTEDPLIIKDLSKKASRTREWDRDWEIKHTECNLSTESGLLKLQELLDEVQSRCSARTVSAESIAQAAEKLFDVIPATKQAMNGVSADLDLESQNFPSAYKYVPESTHVTVTFKRDHWVASNVRRDTCGARGHGATVTLTQEAKDSILNSFDHFDL